MLMFVAACSGSPVPEVSNPPLGPGAEQRFVAVHGQVRQLAVASAPPLVAIAWTSATATGHDIHVATSADNGRLFAGPARITTASTQPMSADAALNLDAVAGTGPARFVVRWRGGADARAQQQGIGVSSDGSPATVVADAGAAAAPVARCANDGTVEWAWGPAASDVADVNHRLPGQACVAGEVVSVRDPRGWIHVVWIGGAHDAGARHVFYAASTDGRWFSRAQVLDQEDMDDPAEVQIAVDPNDTVVTTWRTGRMPAARIVMRQLIPAHHGTAQLLPVTTIAADGSVDRATLTAVRGGVLVAWRRADEGRTTVAFRLVGLDAVCGPEVSPAATTVTGAPVGVATRARGATLYADNGCATCHGPDGRGNGPIAGTLTPTPRDFRDAASFKAGGDEVSIARTLAEGFNQGGSKMPAFSHLSEQERRSLALFVMSLRDQATERIQP